MLLWLADPRGYLRRSPDDLQPYRYNHPDFRAHLDGRIGWLEHLNPDRGARLRRQFESISWPDTPKISGKE